jgi:hypothetical protein
MPFIFKSQQKKQIKRTLKQKTDIEDSFYK